MKLNEVLSKEKRLVVVYGGRFQPFHLGHYHVYTWLCKRFGKQNVWIATSDKTNFDEDSAKVSPFNFREKKEIITSLYDIDPRRIVKCKNPAFSPVEIFDQYQGHDPIYVAAVGEKDESRYSKFLEVDKSINKGEFKDLQPRSKASYFVSVPLDPLEMSGTHIRELLSDSSNHEKIFNRYFGEYNSIIDQLMTSKLKKVR